MPNGTNVNFVVIFNLIRYTGFGFHAEKSYQCLLFSTFNFIDTEKINRINIFIKNNANKQADIICNQNIEKILR